MSFNFEIINENEIKLVKYFGKDNNLVIPSHYYIDQKIYKVTSIGMLSLNNSNIKRIYIPSTINDISINAFVGFNELNLEEILVDENNLFYSSLDGNLYNKDKTVLIKYAPKSPRKKFNVINGIKVFESSCFEAALNLKTIILPNSLLEIKSYAFSSCSNLKNIKLPDSLISLGDFAFFNYESLDKIKLPSLLSYIGEGAFYSLKKSYISLSVSSKNKYFKIFRGGLYSYDKSILYKYFEAGENIKLSHLLKEIKSYAFAYSFINNVLLPENIVNINEYAFVGCKISKIKISKNIKIINKSTFAFCKYLKEVYLNNVNEIKSSAFFSCSKLENIYLSKSISVIDESAFDLTNVEKFIKISNKE